MPADADCPMNFWITVRDDPDDPGELEGFVALQDPDDSAGPVRLVSEYDEHAIPILCAALALSPAEADHLLDRARIDAGDYAPNSSGL